MNLAEVNIKIIETARKAGDFIEQERKSFNIKNTEYKDVNNLVSYVDRAAEQLIVADLKEILPQAGFITEEGTIEQTLNEYNWIIDPLDGTANFIHNLPIYSVSIALVRGLEEQVGVVYDITRNQMFHAFKNGGAFCNDFSISVSNSETLGTSLLATGFPYYQFEKQEQYLDILKSLMQKTHGLRRMGSAAIDLAYTAMGCFDGFYEYNLNSWDMAAGTLLIKEAGGIVTDFSGGQNYLFGGDVVAGSKVHSELLNEIKNHWK